MVVECKDKLCTLATTVATVLKSIHHFYLYCLWHHQIDLRNESKYRHDGEGIMFVNSFCVYSWLSALQTCWYLYSNKVKWMREQTYITCILVAKFSMQLNKIHQCTVCKCSTRSHHLLLKCFCKKKEDNNVTHSGMQNEFLGQRTLSPFLVGRPWVLFMWVDKISQASPICVCILYAINKLDSGEDLEQGSIFKGEHTCSILKHASGR